MSDKHHEFHDLTALDRYIEEYEKKNYVQLWKRDCRTIKTTKSVCPVMLKNCNMKLKYYSITYACTKGGKPYKSKSSGLRTSVTHKDNCPMKIKIRMSKDGQKLYVVSLNEEHNHARDKDLFQRLPKQRRMTAEQKLEAAKMLSLNCNKKLVRSYLEEVTGKPIQLKDLYNLKYGNKCKPDDVDDLIKLLVQDNGFTHVAVTEEGALVGIYYQTPYMKSCFSAYPEVMLLDVYKLNNLDMPLYILMAVNGNSEGDVCAVFLLTEESSDITKHMMQVFKRTNPDWIKIKCFLTDKEFGEKAVLYEEFPEVTHQLCLFHILKRFRSAITNKSMEVTISERKKILNILEKMIYAQSESEYNNLYARLVNLNHKKLTKYFNKWHNLKEEWVECYKKNAYTLGVKTSNHLEGFNEEIKQICSTFSNLESFFENFIILLDGIKLKRKHNAQLLNRDVTTSTSHEDSYLELLTPHAYNLILNNLQVFSKLDVSKNCSEYLVTGSQQPDKMYKVSKRNLKCTCAFNVMNGLPCAHIFAVKSSINGQLFDENLINKRFLKDKYIKTFKSCSVSLVDGEINSSPYELQIMEPKKPILSTEQKYEIALKKCEKLASILSNFNTSDFNSHCDKLQMLINSWSQCKTTKVSEIHELAQEHSVINAEHIEQVTEVFLKEDRPISLHSEEETEIDENTEYLKEEEIVFDDDIEYLEEEYCMSDTDNVEQAIDLHSQEETVFDENTEHLEEEEMIFNEIGEYLEEDKHCKLNKPKDSSLAKLPAIRKRRGCPKGHDVTAIGIKRKKKV